MPGKLTKYVIFSGKRNRRIKLLPLLWIWCGVIYWYYGIVVLYVCEESDSAVVMINEFPGPRFAFTIFSAAISNCSIM